MTRKFTYLDNDGIEQEVAVNYEQYFQDKEGFILDKDHTSIIMIDKIFNEKNAVIDNLTKLDLTTLSEEDKKRFESDTYQYVLEYANELNFNMIENDEHILLLSNKLLSNVQYHNESDKLVLTFDEKRIAIISNVHSKNETINLVLNAREIAKEKDLEQKQMNIGTLEKEVNLTEEYRKLDRKQFEVRLQEKEVELIKESDEKINKIKNDFEEKVESLKTKYENEINSKKEKIEEKKEKIEKLKEAQEEAIKEVKKAQEEAIDNMKKEMEEMATQCEAKVEDALSTASTPKVLATIFGLGLAGAVTYILMLKEIIPMP